MKETFLVWVKTHILTYTIVSLFILLTANRAFFDAVMMVYPFPDEVAFLISLGVLIFLTHLLLMLLTGLLLPLRIVAAVFLILAATLAYFTDQFGTLFNTEMVRNTLETNPEEASDLVSAGLFFRVLLLGVLPAVLVGVWRRPLLARALSFWKRFMAGVVSIVLTLLSAALVVVMFSSHYASFFREHKPLRYFVTPAFGIYSATAYLSSSLKSHSKQVFQSSATFADIPENDHHRELVIMVVGETARADHFSLNGYHRKTNPQLEQIDRLISYSKVTSCGTSTAISVPCMFALEPKSEFDVDSARYKQNILDVIAEADIAVQWRDNNSDSKHVADRIDYVSYKSPDTNPVCDEECRDEGLLSGLQEYVDSQTKDILIVLHMMGSHGPAYYKRYPQKYEKFTPVCQSSDLSACTTEEIVNAYDNSILYTDAVLARVVQFLERNTPKYETAMLYVSDHGESLGENGVYLHGMPDFLAPQEQVHVPVIAWVGASSDINYAETVKLKDIPASHDAVAQALMNVMEVQSDVSLPDVPPLFVMYPEH